MECQDNQVLLIFPSLLLNSKSNLSLLNSTCFLLNRLLATTKILELTISEIWDLMKQNYYYKKLLEEQLI